LIDSIIPKGFRAKRCNLIRRSQFDLKDTFVNIVDILEKVIRVHQFIDCNQNKKILINQSRKVSN